MRRGITPKILTNSQGEFLGINLGSDACAEHEWGIKDIEQAFGVDKNAEAGIERHRVQKIPTSRGGPFSTSSEGESMLGIAFSLDQRTGRFGYPFNYIKDTARGLELYDKNLAAGWSERDFGVAFTKELATKMQELYDAFVSKDAAFVFSSALPVFENPGLCLVIISQLDQEVLDSLRDKHLESERLKAASDATGIHERLRAAGMGQYQDRGYFACSPKWVSDRLKQETKHPVMYWLNPYDQQNNNFGWYTVEQLDEWIAGKGPVPMTTEQKAARRR